MKKLNVIFRLLFTVMFCTVIQSLTAQNPYLPLWEHLPDGEPRVFEDPDQPGKYRAYIIGSHDVRFDSYCGPDIRMWSAPVENLSQWRDEGAIFTYHIQNQWDVMYAPDLVEIKQKDGTKAYYLYPHSRGNGREAMVCKGSRPNGPFTPVNLNAEGTQTVQGSILGFDPSVFIENITNSNDPDYATGFRAYGFWGFQRSLAAQLDQKTMYSLRPGTEIIPYFIPASARYGVVRDPAGTTYPALYKGQKPGEFNFFEASSIRQVGNKYVMIFSGFSGPDYGLGSTNSTLRYAFGDSPLGPWRSGGVLVDSRGVVLNQDGSHLQTTNAAHNTHGSLQQINDQWYVFYHRPPRGFGFARQAMVAPVTIKWDEKPVAEGGTVEIRGYDPYAKDGVWRAKASNGDEYTGAEVTSEGFQIYGLDPYKYYSAGYACYLSNIGSQQDTWDIWDNSMPIHVRGGDIIGYKYFGFGGLTKAQKGLQPFDGTKKGNNTVFNLFLAPQTNASFKVSVWLDGPWDNHVWKGKKIGEITVPAGSAPTVTKYTVDVSAVVDKLDKKHAIFLVAEGSAPDGLCVLQGLGFSKNGESLDYPEPPLVSILVNNQRIDMPATPKRSTNENGITGYDQYEVEYTIPAYVKGVPSVTAYTSNEHVKVNITQAAGRNSQAVVKFDYKGIVKTYTISFKEEAIGQRPLIQTKYTADPSPMVHNDTVFLYTTHDEDDADGFKMFDWLLYTSTDMVNWTDHGTVASLRNFRWNKRTNGAWALHVIERNGKFYMYCPIHGNGIGVLVSDSPYGPFKDPLDKPLVWQKEHWNDIDPTAFIDDDGQAYLYWGNPEIYYVKLNEDMISYSGPIVKLPKQEHYQEGPWPYKRNGHYYLAFASTCCPEGIGYAMSDKPTGPWTTKGYIMRPTQRTRGNHPGIIDYKGNSYVFGLNYDLMHLETFQHHERRSVSVAKMHYNADGTIQEVPYWTDNAVEQLGTFDPYHRVEAETMAWGYGLKTEKMPDGRICLKDIDYNETLLLRGVNFNRGAREFSVMAACNVDGGTIEIRLDSADGRLIGTLPVTPTGGMDRYKLLSCPVRGAFGVHDLYFCFKSHTQQNNLFFLDYWMFR